MVAIKYMQDYDQGEYNCVKTLREIKILKYLTDLPDNLYSVKILNVLLPQKITEGSPKNQEKTGTRKQEGKGIFIVMEYMGIDLKEFLKQYQG